MPEQVYISARAIGKMPAPSESPPAILVLDYSHTGVWAAYGYLTSRVGETYQFVRRNLEKEFQNLKSMETSVVDWNCLIPLWNILGQYP